MIEADQRILKVGNKILMVRIHCVGGTYTTQNESMCYSDTLSTWYRKYKNIGYTVAVLLYMPPISLLLFNVDNSNLFFQNKSVCTRARMSAHCARMV